MEDGLDCLARYAALARAAGAESIAAVATCAVREAANGGEFVRRARRETGIRLAVISGEEEARLITRAVRADLPPSCDPLLVLDIGGGSTEVVVATGEKVLLAESLDLGAVRLTDLHVSSDPLSPRDEKALRKTDPLPAEAAREARREGEDQDGGRDVRHDPRGGRDRGRPERPRGRRRRPPVALAARPEEGRRPPRLLDAQAEGAHRRPRRGPRGHRDGRRDPPPGAVPRVRDRDAPRLRALAPRRARPRVPACRPAGARASGTCGANPSGASRRAPARRRATPSACATSRSRSSTRRTRSTSSPRSSASGSSTRPSCTTSGSRSPTRATTTTRTT